MAVPKFFEFFVPVLWALDQHSPIKAKDLREQVARYMKLTDEDMNEWLPSRRQLTYQNRIHWAITYLKNAGLVKNIKRGEYSITEQGHKSYTEDADKIDLRYLERFDSFVKFHTVKPEEPSGGNTSQALPDLTPYEIIENAYRTIREELSKTLLTTIMECSPDFFEHLVVDLLLAMGYGYDSSDAGLVVGKTGDGGIDGIINEDKLGFSQVYVQAKRWDPDHTIGRPDVQTFAGALLGKGATKGLYITTAHFSSAARQYVDDQKAMRVVLVDGAELTRLMIDNGVGVSVQQKYTIMQMDGDYFDN